MAVSTEGVGHILGKLVEVSVDVDPLRPVTGPSWRAAASGSDSCYHLARSGDLDLLGFARLNGGDNKPVASAEVLL